MGNEKDIGGNSLMDEKSRNLEDARESTEHSNIQAHQSTVKAANALISKALTAALEQLDTKLTFELVLLNDQLVQLGTSNQSLQDENSALKAQLAKDKSEHEEMCQYLNDTVTTLSNKVSCLELDYDKAKAKEVQYMEEALREKEMIQYEATAEVTKAKLRLAEVEKELLEVHTFINQRADYQLKFREMEQNMVEVVEKNAQDKLEMERKVLVVKNTLKNEFAQNLQQTKEVIIQESMGQLSAKTKATMVENEIVRSELHFQSKETMKMLEKIQHMELEMQKLRVRNKILEENQHLVAKKNYYYHKIFQQLKETMQWRKFPSEVENMMKSVENSNAESINSHELQSSSLNYMTNGYDGSDTTLITQIPLTQRTQALENKLIEVEKLLEQTREQLVFFQDRTEYILNYHDDIVAFLSRALHESTSNPHTNCNGDKNAQSDIRKSLDSQDVTTMNELVRILPPLHVSDISGEDIQNILQFLLAKVVTYQNQCIQLYEQEGSTICLSRKQKLEKFLGLELPPIRALNLQSPSHGQGSMHPLSSWKQNKYGNTSVSTYATLRNDNICSTRPKESPSKVIRISSDRKPEQSKGSFIPAHSNVVTNRLTFLEYEKRKRGQRQKILALHSRDSPPVNLSISGGPSASAFPQVQITKRSPKIQRRITDPTPYPPSSVTNPPSSPVEKEKELVSPWSVATLPETNSFQ